MIYFIDEDYRKLRALVSELDIEGYDTKVIRDADNAFVELSGLSGEDVDLVIIDVMLAAKESCSKYTREETDDYHQTGLLLLDDLVQVNPRVFPKYAVYLTHATSADLVKVIITSAKKYGIKVLRKGNYDTGYDFAKDVKNIMKELRNKL
jgi:DNA-binding NarL/FixJ family response regulator